MLKVIHNRECIGEVSKSVIVQHNEMQQILKIKKSEARIEHPGKKEATSGEPSRNKDIWKSNHTKID